MISYMQMSDGRRLRMDWERVAVGGGNGADCPHGLVRLSFHRRCGASPIMPAGEEASVYILDRAEFETVFFGIQKVMAQ